MKVAASPRIYMGRCPKVVFKLQVTSHSTPLIPSYSSLLSNLARGTGLTLNPSTYINPLTRMPKMSIGSTYLKYGFTQRGIFMPVPVLTSAMYLSKPQP